MLVKLLLVLSLWIPETAQGSSGDIPSGKGEIRLLYKDWEEATGYEYRPRDQGSSDDCVGQAVATAIDIRTATQSLEGPYRVPQFKVDASSIYGLSRIEIGNTKWKAGSKVSWGLEAVSEYGVLYRKNYLYAGYDLSKYDPKKSLEWGKNGLPDTLEKIAKFNPLISYYPVRSYEEVRDAIVAGYPVVVGSNVGFYKSYWQPKKGERDRHGFSQRRGVWKHAMVFVGIDDKNKKGACCLNSWGSKWVTGPTRLNQPKGSFWVHPQTVDIMVKQGAAYAIVEIQSTLDYGLRANRLIVVSEPWCKACKSIELYLKSVETQYDIHKYTLDEWNKAYPKPENHPQVKSIPTIMYVQAIGDVNQVLHYRVGLED